MPEILAILINRRTRELSREDIQQIASTYHNWRNPDGHYEDVPGFVLLLLLAK
jgi:type I restriction enzyme M protein